MKTGKIYKISNSQNSFYYIGSTVQTLPNRMYKHRIDCLKERNKNNKFYKKMLEIGLKNWYIEALEFIDIVNLEELRKLRKLEDKYINLLDINCLNMKKALGIYRTDFKTDSDYQKKRYELAKEKDRERAKKRWQKIKNDPELHNKILEKQRERYILKKK